MPAIKRVLLALLLVFGTAASADTIELNPDHPDRYVVVKGDTLWDIAGRFLRDPWRWPQVWQVNPQIENPHLIYPGDVVALVFRDGKPELRLEPGPQRPAQAAAPSGVPTVKLSPHARSLPLTLEAAVHTIPLDAIAQFLKRTRAVSERELQAAAYIVASEEDRLIAGTGNRVYVRGIVPTESQRYTVVRIGEAYRNPGAPKNEILGYEAIYIGEAELQSLGDPATARIIHAKREALMGDKLLPISTEEINTHFVPHAPELPVEGKIISVVDGVSRIGQYQVVVLNRGEIDGMEVGHVLAVYQSGETVRDTVDPKRGAVVTLPDERAGLVMIVRVFEQVSYALVMRAQRDMRLYDNVKNP